MAIDYSFIWLALQIIIFFIMIGPIPLFFYIKYKQDKASQEKQGMNFNLRLIFFFIFTAINEIVYIIEAVPELSSAILGWNGIFDIKLYNTLFIDIPLETHYFIVFPLFFLSFI